MSVDTWFHDESLDEFDGRLRLWAARVLDVAPETIKSVETEWWGLCDTCEYSGGQIRVTLTDGRVFHDEQTFGLFLAEILRLDLNEDGTLTSGTGWKAQEPFDLKQVVAA